MTKKIVYIVIVFLVCFLGFVFVRNKKSSNHVKNCKTSFVQKGNIKKTIEIDAKLKSSNYADISTEIPTLVRWVGVSVNDSVKKGQKLVTLDRATISAQIRNLKLAVERAELAEQEGRLKSRHLSEKQKLSLKKASQQARERLSEAYAQSKKTIIRSPINGIVVEKNINEGEIASRTLLRIVDTSSLQIEALVPEVDITKIKKGQEVSVVFDAYTDKPQKGIVKLVEMGALELQGNTYFKAIIEVSNSDNLLLLEGMNAEVTVEYENKNNVLVISRDFVKKDENGYFVYQKTIDNGNESFKKVYFEHGLIGDNNVEIKKGLLENQTLFEECNK